MATRQRGFGPAKPLPGQKGYKSKKSELLENDAATMERKLNALRQQLVDDKIKRENVNIVGGSRWKSARADKGSVRNYAQDVLTKKQRASGKKSSGKKKKIKSNPSSWSIQQVSAWLNELNLGDYASVFAENEIDGSIIFDMGLDDLDYLGVTKLSHRKIFLKNLEALKRGDDRIHTLPAPAVVNDEHLHEPPSPSNNPGDIEESGKKHWSHVAPISENKIEGDGSVAVNLADGEFDEDASHNSFLKALLEWRQSDSVAASEETKQDDGMWNNPFAADPDAPSHPETDEKGGQLLEGSFDEEKEHEAFRRAVEAWRTGGQPSVQNNEKLSTGSGDLKKSCWNCYKVYNSSQGFVDESTKKEYCSEPCQQKFDEQYCRFYQNNEAKAELNR